MYDIFNKYISFESNLSLNISYARRINLIKFFNSEKYKNVENNLCLYTIFDDIMFDIYELLNDVFRQMKKEQSFNKFISQHKNLFQKKYGNNLNFLELNVKKKLSVSQNSRSFNFKDESNSNDAPQYNVVHSLDDVKNEIV